jgi:hypothetical protein
MPPCPASPLEEDDEEDVPPATVAGLTFSSGEHADAKSAGKTTAVEPMKHACKSDSPVFTRRT